MLERNERMNCRLRTDDIVTICVRFQVPYFYILKFFAIPLWCPVFIAFFSLHRKAACVCVCLYFPFVIFHLPFVFSLFLWRLLLLLILFLTQQVTKIQYMLAFLFSSSLLLSFALFERLTRRQKLYQRRRRCFYRK